MQFKLIQINTDCVFSGEGNYTEESYHDCDDLYGKTKSLGESKSSLVYNIRCSIIVARIVTYYSLFNWVLNHKHSPIIKGYMNHY